VWRLCHSFKLVKCSYQRKQPAQRSTKRDADRAPAASIVMINPDIPLVSEDRRRWTRMSMRRPDENQNGPPKKWRAEDAVRKLSENGTRPRREDRRARPGSGACSRPPARGQTADQAARTRAHADPAPPREPAPPRGPRHGDPHVRPARGGRRLTPAWGAAEAGIRGRGRLSSVEAQSPAHLVLVHDRVGVAAGDAPLVG
jgi:hypothetical protein